MTDLTAAEVEALAAKIEQYADAVAKRDWQRLPITIPVRDDNADMRLMQAVELLREYAKDERDYGMLRDRHDELLRERDEARDVAAENYTALVEEFQELSGFRTAEFPNGGIGICEVLAKIETRRVHRPAQTLRERAEKAEAELAALRGRFAVWGTIEDTEYLDGLPVAINRIEVPDEDANTFGLYFRLPGGRARHVRDFPTRAAAEAAIKGEGE